MRHGGVRLPLPLLAPLLGLGGAIAAAVVVAVIVRSNERRLRKRPPACTTIPGCNPNAP